MIELDDCRSALHLSRIVEADCTFAFRRFQFYNNLNCMVEPQKEISGTRCLAIIQDVHMQYLTHLIELQFCLENLTACRFYFFEEGHQLNRYAFSGGTPELLPPTLPILPNRILESFNKFI